MRTLRVIPAWPLSWALFGIAHLASVFLERLHSEGTEPTALFQRLFTLYQRSMSTSYAVQEWAEGGGPALARFPWQPGPEGSAA